LSIDWGEAFPQPTLTPYEALVALGAVPPWWEQELPLMQQQQRQQPRPNSQQQQQLRQVGNGVQHSVQEDNQGATSDCDAREGAEVGSAQGGGEQARQLACDGADKVVRTGEERLCDMDEAGKGGLTPYPMDYYSRDGGPWNSSYHKPQQRGSRPARQQ